MKEQICSVVWDQPHQHRPQHRMTTPDGPKPSQLSHIPHTDTISCCKADSAWRNLHPLCQLTQISVQQDRLETLSPHSHRAQVWLLLRWEQHTAVQEVHWDHQWQPHSFLVPCSLHSLKKWPELSRQSAEVTAGPADPPHPAALCTSVEVLYSHWKILTPIEHKTRKGKKNQNKTEQMMSFQLKWCSSSLSSIRSLSLNKIAWTPQRAWSCSKHLHSNVEPKTATFRAAHPRGRAVHGITIAHLAWRAGKCNSFPKLKHSWPCKKKGNERLNITYKVRKSHFWEVMFRVGSYII